MGDQIEFVSLPKNSTFERQSYQALVQSFESQVIEHWYYDDLVHVDTTAQRPIVRGVDLDDRNALRKCFPRPECATNYMRSLRAFVHTVYSPLP